MKGDVKKIGNQAFNSNKRIETLILSEGVKYIGKYATYDMPNLRTLILPRTLKGIDEYGIGNCPHLENVYHYSSESPEIIGEGVFSNCKTMKGINFIIQMIINRNGKQIF